MSYQVIARKWRPQSFDSLVGQKHVSKTLLNALKNDRLHHALIFSGPRGVGKTSTARILAKSLRCPNAQDFVPCNTCSTCEDIAAGTSIDVIEIDGASNNSVDDIRVLREGVGIMPSSGKYKIYIIDEVHMLSTSAFNALLKTLEEPPAHVKFIFATTEPQKIPPTILGRCQRFDFRRIPTREIVERLKAICSQESLSAEDDALWVLARQSDGSLRDSQNLLEMAIAFSDGKLTRSQIEEVLGLTSRALILDTLKAILTHDTLAALGCVEKIFVSGQDPRLFSQDILEYFRHMLLIKLSGAQTTEIVDLPDSEIMALRELSSTLSSEDLHLLFDMALKGANDLPRAQSPRLVLEMLLLRMAEAPKIVDIKTLVSQIRSGGMDHFASTSPAANPTLTTHASSTSLNASLAASLAASSKAGSQPAAKASPAAAASGASREPGPSAPPSSQAPAPQSGPARFNSALSPSENWASLVQAISKLQPALGAKLENTSMLRIENSHLYVGVKKSHEFLFQNLSSASTLQVLVNYLRTFWGPKFQLTFEMIADAPTPSPKDLEVQKHEQEQARIRQEVESDPLVQQAKKIFKTQVKEIKETR